MSLKRKILKSAMMNLDDNILQAHKQTPEQIKRNIEIMQELRDAGDTDARTRKMAAEFLIRHSYDIYAHEHPAVQKTEIEHKGLPIPPNELTVKIIMPDEVKKSAINRRKI